MHRHLIGLDWYDRHQEAVREHEALIRQGKVPVPDPDEDGSTCPVTIMLTDSTGKVINDLSGADLHAACLRFLEGADLPEKVNLLEEDEDVEALKEVLMYGDVLLLDGADLSGADLSGSHLCGCSLRGCNLRGADLSEGEFNGASFDGADLRGADLNGDFREATFRGADLRGALMVHGAFDGADMTGADLRGALIVTGALDDAITMGAELPLAVRHS